MQLTAPGVGWRATLMAEPLVHVAASRIHGDGLFAARDLSAGELVTWTEPAGDNGQAAPADPYRENWLDWYEAIGCYSGADPSNRRAQTGPVGHLANDRAGLDLYRATARPSTAAAYVEASEAGENVRNMAYDEGIELMYTTRPVARGEELYRSYGLGYWLPDVESRAALAMQWARCDVRLAAAVTEDEALAKDARRLFGTFADRVAALCREAGLPPKKRFRDFDGYGAYFYAARASSDLRLAYSQSLGLNDLLDTPDQRDAVADVQALETRAYVDLVEARLNPPLGGAHFDTFRTAVFDQGLVLGATEDLPW